MNQESNKRFLYPICAIISSLSIYMLILLFKIRLVLPIEYLLGFASILGLLNVGLWLFASKPPKKKGIVVKVILAIAMVASISNTYIAYRLSSAMDILTRGEGRVDMISVVTNYSDKEEAPPLKDLQYGILSTMDRTNTEYAIRKISQDGNADALMITSYETLDQLMNDFEKKTIDAIILNDAYRDTILSQGYRLENTSIVYQFWNNQAFLEEAPTLNTATKPYSVLLSGVGSKGDTNLSSTGVFNAVLTVNPVTREMLFLYLPKDLYLENVCMQASTTLAFVNTDGIECTMSSLEELLNVKIDFFVRFNYKSLATLIDSLGGISIDNPSSFIVQTTSQSKPEYMQFPAGVLSLNGNETVEWTNYYLNKGEEYAAFTTIVPELNRILSFYNVYKNAVPLLNNVSKLFFTNFNKSQLSSIIKQELQQNMRWQLNVQTITGEIKKANLYHLQTMQTVFVSDSESIVNISEQMKRILETDSLVSK
ncbi:MAG: LCP family protein [Erysipelotrichaceae bacterium]